MDSQGRFTCPHVRYTQSVCFSHLMVVPLWRVSVRVSPWHERNACVRRCVCPFLFLSRRWWGLLVFASLSGRACPCFWFICGVDMTETPSTSNARAFRQVEEDLSTGKWCVLLECVARPAAPAAICETCVDEGLAASSGTWDPKSPAPIKCLACEALVGGYDSRCGPKPICEYIFLAPCCA